MPLGGKKNSIYILRLSFPSFFLNNSAFWQRKVCLCVVKAMHGTLIVSCINSVADRQELDFTQCQQCCGAVSENPHQPLRSPVICIAIDQCLLLSKGQLRMYTKHIVVNFWKGQLSFPLSNNLMFATLLSHSFSHEAFFFTTSAGICKEGNCLSH